MAGFCFHTSPHIHSFSLRESTIEKDWFWIPKLSPSASWFPSMKIQLQYSTWITYSEWLTIVVLQAHMLRGWGGNKAICSYLLWPNRYYNNWTSAFLLLKYRRKLLPSLSYFQKRFKIHVFNFLLNMTILFSKIPTHTKHAQKSLHI